MPPPLSTQALDLLLPSASVSSRTVRPHGEVTELASGIDALYLSGRGDLPLSLLTELAEGRQAAEEADGPVPFTFGGVEFGFQPRSFGKYKYSLINPHMQVGVPQAAAQPRAGQWAWPWWRSGTWSCTCSTESWR